MRIQFSDCTLDTEARSLRRGGQTVHLTPKALQLLELLLEARPRPLSKETLLEKLWPDTFVSEANLPSLIKEIRDAIGDDARAPRFIKTAHRHGYSFSGAATALDVDETIDSIAVLPFENLSGQSDGEVLADGIAEAVIAMLSSLPDVRVAPRAASFRYRGRDGELDLLRRDLNVRASISGRLRFSGGSFVVAVELTDLERQSQLWGQQFRSSADDIVELQSRICSEISSHLHLRLGADARRRLARKATSNPAAYQAYLKGRHHWNRRTAEGIERAIFHFQSALDLDAQMALAWSGLADCYIALGSRDLLPPRQLFPKAKDAAQHALELDPELAEAHASLGAFEEVFAWNFRAAEESLVESLRLNPSYSTGRLWYGQALAHHRRFEEALAQLRLAEESDPLSVTINVAMAMTFYLARDFASAIPHLERALEVNPHHEPAHTLGGLVALQQRQHEIAQRELERSMSISRGEPHVIAALAAVEASTGRVDEARKRLTTLREMSVTRTISPVHLALIHISLDELDRAFDELRRAIELRSGWLVFLATDPRFDALRGDERFEAMVMEVGVVGSG